MNSMSQLMEEHCLRCGLFDSVRLKMVNEKTYETLPRHILKKNDFVVLLVMATINESGNHREGIIDSIQRETLEKCPNGLSKKLPKSILL